MKILRTDYTFNAAARTLTFTNPITLEGFMVITNVTDGIIIYNFADPSLGGSISSLTLTLEADTTAMSNSDDIQIWYWDENAEQAVDTGLAQPLTDTQLRASAVPVSGTVTANLGTLNGAATAANQATLIGHVDAVETLLGTIDADTSNISTKIDTLAAAVSGSEMQVDVVNTVNISATNLDVRDLTSVSDSVAAVQSGTWNITNVSGTVSLPTGAATASKQDAIIAAIEAIPGGGGGSGVQYTDGDIDATPTGNVGMYLDTGDNSIKAVSDVNPLPVLASIDTTGLATESKQDTAIAAIEAPQYLDGDVDATPTGVLMMVRNSGDNSVHAVADNNKMPVDITNATIDAVGSNMALENGNLAQIAADASTINSSTAQTATDMATVVTNTGNISTKIDTIAGAVSGTEVQVDVLTMPTTTVTATNFDIRDLSSASDSVAAVQSGTWNISNISGTVSLPTGAATAANQSTIIGHLDGVEGLLTTVDADTDAIKTSVELIDDTVAILGTATYTEAATKGITIGAVRRDADTTLVNTTNEIAPLQVDANGRLKVEAFSGETLPVSLASTTVTGTVAVTQSGTWDEVGINDSGNSITVDAPVGAPAFVRLSDGSAAITTLPVSLASVPSHPVTNAGTFAVQATLQSNSGVDVGDVDVTSISAGSNLIGDVNLQSRTGGGAVSIFRSLDLDETEEEIKGTAGALYGYYFANTNASARYLKFYNATAASVTVGSTTPLLTLYLPPTSAGHISFAYGVNFSTAITAAATTGVADSDTGAPGANDVILNVFYK